MKMERHPAALFTCVPKPHPDGLLSTQRDAFDTEDWGILLHAVFPGHPFGVDPAPQVQVAEMVLGTSFRHLTLW